ncbi:MAG: DUF2189 domain-containing protein [Methyloligellaceae bacterium]
MANANAIGTAQADAALPAVRKIGPADLKEALSRGLDDFRAKPSHVIFICLIYPLIGLVLARLTFGYDMLPLLFPLMAGFVFVGPIAALGLYELSRRREQGLEITWRHAFGVFRSRSIGAILALGAVLLAIFFAWLGAAQTIYTLTFGDAVPTSITGFARDVLITRQGWMLIVLGNGIGLLFAVLVLAISVVSFPLLLDRPVGAAAAALTSVKACLANPIAMALWGLIVVVGLVIGSLPFFVGLTIVLPVLGHATWHLYRRVVAH